MEQEVFSTSIKDNLVKALGLKVDCVPKELHIYVNGQDITKSVVLEEIRITYEKKV